MYSEKAIDHFRNPRNLGVLKNPDGKGVAIEPSCGDSVYIYLRVEDNVISDIKFESMGCAGLIASSSMLTELVKGKTIDEALKLSRGEVEEGLGGLPPIKAYAPSLAERALYGAIQDYLQKK
ncbi:MAG: iron-sulfur cluster assembly scaffold protein [Candidatus Hydrothermarchaeales archaeon]